MNGRWRTTWKQMKKKLFFCVDFIISRPSEHCKVSETSWKIKRNVYEINSVYFEPQNSKHKWKQWFIIITHSTSDFISPTLRNVSQFHDSWWFCSSSLVALAPAIQLLKLFYEFISRVLRWAMFSALGGFHSAIALPLIKITNRFSDIAS